MTRRLVAQPNLRPATHHPSRRADLDWLLAGGSYPVQVMTKWLLALRLVCQVRPLPAQPPIAAR